MLLAQAMRRAPEASACRPGADGTPSRLAKTLMDLVERDGGHCEAKISPSEFLHLRDSAPDARWHRAVYRLTDGSVIAVYDQGAEVAESEDYVLRHPSGQFAGVWDGDDPEELARSFASALDRLQVIHDDTQAQGVAGYFSGRALDETDAVRQHPLEDICGVINVCTDGTAVLATRRGVLLMPGSADGIKEVLDHAYACMTRMSQKLGIGTDEMLAELNPTVELYQRAFQAYEAHRKFSAEDTLKEFSPRN